MSLEQRACRAIYRFYELASFQFQYKRGKKVTKIGDAALSAVKLYSDEEIENVTQYCYRQWHKDPEKLKRFFNPITVFKPVNFERYAGVTPTQTSEALFGGGKRTSGDHSRRCSDDSHCNHPAAWYETRDHRWYCRFHSDPDRRGQVSPAKLDPLPTGFSPAMREHMKSFERCKDETPEQYLARLKREASTSPFAKYLRAR